MTTSIQGQSDTTVLRLEPAAKPPVAAVLNTLGAEDEKLLDQRLTTPAECMFVADFDAPDAEARFLAPMPPGPETRRRRRMRNDDSGIDLLCGAGMSFTPEQETHMFLRLNYCRYRVYTLLKGIGARRLNAAETRELLKWENATTLTREEIVRANVPLVLAMAKRTRITGVDYAEMISEGNMALMRSVEKFDCHRGYKFSTYSCRAILKSFSRVATRTSRYRGYFPTEFDPSMEKSDHLGSKRRGVEGDCIDELRTILNGSEAADLSDTEVQVIRARFALDNAPEAGAKTLEQVGEMIGVTKERVRQIQNKALAKLRTVLESRVLSA